ncbi:MAG TPA: zinc-dependent alcohol dehydrogenase family protein [Candidatus Angelobacter sp.]|nr:zinc-dependent alcohol dehydrogenase family protein [Candidatus Angelobacter sp.]
MLAQVLKTPAPVEQHPLIYLEVPTPELGDDEVLVKVNVCGVCRTDLHVVEGELAPRLPSVIPGHQVVGTITKRGKEARKHAVGARVGIPWLHRTDGTCEYCTRGQENLCEKAQFTGWTVNGGYSEYIVAPQAFVYPIPDGFSDIEAAPLLCAGIIGFRALRLANLQKGDTLGIYGFGAAGHVCIQVARHWGIRVMVCTRESKHQKLARELGAEWVGGAYDTPPERLNAAIIFAPAGELVPAALAVLEKAGTLVLGGIHMSPIPSFPYELLYHERVVRSVANNTRKDGMDFLKVAAEIPVRTQTQIFDLKDANRALEALKHDAIQGAAVLRISS